MTAWTIVAAVLVSVGAVAHLARTDPVRRRVAGLPASSGARRPLLALTVAIFPGLLLLSLGDGAGFASWLGALSVLGWRMAALQPAQAAAFRGAVRDRGLRCFAGGRTRAGALHARAVALCHLGDTLARIETLERRVTDLEQSCRPDARHYRADDPPDQPVATNP